MRIYLLAIVWAVSLWALPASAQAESGHKARFVSTVTLKEGYFEAVNKAAGTVAEKLLASDMVFEPHTGTVFITPSKLRLDSLMVAGNTVVTTLLDFKSQQYLILDHTRQTAWAMDFSSFEQLESEIGLPIGYPEQMFCRWPDIERELLELSGAKLKRLGSRTIAGETCHGFRISTQLTDVFKADGFTPSDGIPPLKEIKGLWIGEFWVSSRFNLPVTMKLSFLGIDYGWELTGIEDWTVVEALLALPRGYKAQPISAEEMVQALSLGHK